MMRVCLHAGRAVQALHVALCGNAEAFGHSDITYKSGVMLHKKLRSSPGFYTGIDVWELADALCSAKMLWFVRIR